MKHPVDVHVGKRLRHRRWLVGMTQQQLGDAVGIKFQQIQKYETGMNRVSASRLWALSRVLDVPVSYFFEEIDEAEATAGSGVAATPEVADPKPRQAPEAGVLEDRETLELVRAYYNIPEEQRRRLYELTRSLSANAA